MLSTSNCGTYGFTGKLELTPRGGMLKYKNAVAVAGGLPAVGRASKRRPPRIYRGGPPARNLWLEPNPPPKRVGFH